MPAEPPLNLQLADTLALEGARSVVMLDGSAQYAAASTSQATGNERIAIIDVSDHTDLREVASVDVDAGATIGYQIDALGSLVAAVHTGGGNNWITVVDVSNPLAPGVVGTYSNSLISNPSGLRIVGNQYLYARLNGRVAIFSNIQGGTLVLESDPATAFGGNFARFGDDLLVLWAGSGQLRVYDTSTAPTLTTVFSDDDSLAYTSDAMMGVQVDSRYMLFEPAEVGSQGGIIDMANPAAPVVTLFSRGTSLAVEELISFGDYVVNDIGQVWDVSDPTTPVDSGDNFSTPFGLSQTYRPPGVMIAADDAADDAVLSYGLVTNIPTGGESTWTDPRSPMGGGGNGWDPLPPSPDPSGPYDDCCGAEAAPVDPCYSDTPNVITLLRETTNNDDFNEWRVWGGRISNGNLAIGKRPGNNGNQLNVIEVAPGLEPVTRGILDGVANQYDFTSDARRYIWKWDDQTVIVGGGFTDSPFTGTYWGLHFFDISDPDNPTWLRSWNDSTLGGLGMGPEPKNIYNRGDGVALVVQAWHDGAPNYNVSPWLLLNISDLDNPTLIDSYDPTQVFEAASPAAPVGARLNHGGAIHEVSPGVVVVEGSVYSSALSGGFYYGVSNGFTVLDITGSTIVEKFTYNNNPALSGHDPGIPIDDSGAVLGDRFYMGRSSDTATTAPPFYADLSDLNSISITDLPTLDTITFTNNSDERGIFRRWDRADGTPGMAVLNLFDTGGASSVTRVYRVEISGSPVVVDEYGGAGDGGRFPETAPIPGDGDGTLWFNRWLPGAGTYENAAMLAYGPFPVDCACVDDTIGPVTFSTYYSRLDFGNYLTLTPLGPGLCVTRSSNDSFCVVWDTTGNAPVWLGETSAVTQGGSMSEKFLANATKTHVMASSYQWFKVVDVTDPANPTGLPSVDISSYNLPSTGTAGDNGCAAMCGDYFVGAVKEAIIVINVADPTNPQVTAVDLTFFPTTNRKGMAAGRDGMFVCAENGQAHVVDLSDPANPVLASSISNSLIQFMASDCSQNEGTIQGDEWFFVASSTGNAAGYMFRVNIANLYGAAITETTAQTISLGDVRTMCGTASHMYAGSVADNNLTCIRHDQGSFEITQTYRDGPPGNVWTPEALGIVDGELVVAGRASGSIGKYASALGCPSVVDDPCDYTLPDGVQGAVAPIVGNGIELIPLTMTGDSTTTGTVTGGPPYFSRINDQDGVEVILDDDDASVLCVVSSAIADANPNGVYGGKWGMWAEHYGRVLNHVDDVVTCEVDNWYNGADSFQGGVSIPVSTSGAYAVRSAPLNCALYSFLADSPTNMGIRIRCNKTSQNMGADGTQLVTDRATTHLAVGAGRTTWVPGTYTAARPNMDYSRATVEGDGQAVEVPWASGVTTEYLSFRLPSFTAETVNAFVLVTTARATAGWTNLTARILSKDVIIAAADSGGTPQAVMDTFPSSFCRRTLSFDWVNPAATSEDLTNAYVEYAWTPGSDMSGLAEFDFVGVGGVFADPGGLVINDARNSILVSEDVVLFNNLLDTPQLVDFSNLLGISATSLPQVIDPFDSFGMACNSAAIEGNIVVLPWFRNFNSRDYGVLRVYQVGNPADFDTWTLRGEISGTTQQPWGWLGYSFNESVMVDGYCYIPALNRIEIFNVTNPDSPSYVGPFGEIAGEPPTITRIATNYVWLSYVNSASNDIRVYDITNRASPQQVYARNVGGPDPNLRGANGIVVNGGTEFLAFNGDTAETWVRYGISDPENPTVIDYGITDGGACSAIRRISDTKAMLAQYNGNGFLIIDPSLDPGDPGFVLSTILDPSAVEAAEVIKSQAWAAGVTTDTGVQFIVMGET